MHLFFLCEFADAVWRHIYLWTDSAGLAVADSSDIFLTITKGGKTYQRRIKRV